MIRWVGVLSQQHLITQDWRAEMEKKATWLFKKNGWWIGIEIRFRCFDSETIFYGMEEFNNHLEQLELMLQRQLAIHRGKDVQCCGTFEMNQYLCTEWSSIQCNWSRLFSYSK